MFILELPRPVCADDGGEFISPGDSIERVHVFGGTEPAGKALDAAVGQQVTVRGPAFGAHTGHHRAPLVLEAFSVTAN
ncbi:MAG: DUF4431 domain-containing protein [Sphingomonas sp.]